MSDSTPASDFPNLARLCSTLGLPMAPRFNTRDTGRLLGLRERTILYMVKAGRLTAYRPSPRVTWFDAATLEAFLAARQPGGAEVAHG